MPRSYGFMHVSDKGFASFVENLAASPWKEIPEPDPAKPLANESSLTVTKARVTISIETLLSAMGTSSKALEADIKWDRRQTQLFGQVLIDENHDSADRRARAGRVRSLLLMGSGTQQNALDVDAEVDFGLAQVAQCRRKPLCDDIAKLGYEPHISQILEATRELALVIGRVVSDEEASSDAARPVRATSRSVAIRQAISGCVSAFNSAMDQLDFLIANTAPKHQSLGQLTALRDSLQDLLDRHPAVASVREPELKEPPIPVIPKPGNNPNGDPFLE